MAESQEKKGVRAYANVPLSKSAEEAYHRSEEFWSGPKLVSLTVATMAVSLVVLYSMAQVTSETYWSDWLIPN